MFKNWILLKTKVTFNLKTAAIFHEISVDMPRYLSKAIILNFQNVNSVLNLTITIYALRNMAGYVSPVKGFDPGLKSPWNTSEIRYVVGNKRHRLAFHRAGTYGVYKHKY